MEFFVKGSITNFGGNSTEQICSYLAQVRWLGPRIGGRLALFCIYRVKRVYGALLITSRICYGAFKLLYHYY